MAQVRIFVSHSHQDNEWCRPMVAALKAVGYDVWYDETGLTGGDAWVASIQREVQARDVFLLVLSPEAWDSKWVQDELQLAIATRRRILPVLLRNTQVDGFLLTTQWVTVIGEEPQVAARSIILAIEAPPAPGRSATPPVPTETLDGLTTLCKALATEGRYTEALSACDRALALDPDNIDVLRVKVAVLDIVDQHPQATAACIHLLSLLNANSKNRSEIRMFSKYLIDHSDDVEALVQLFRTIRSLGESPDDMGENSPWGAVDSSVNYLSKLRKNSEGTNQSMLLTTIIRRLAKLGATAALEELAYEDYNAPEFEAIIAAIAETGSLAVVMDQATRVRSAGYRALILTTLYNQLHYNEIDQLCRDWFGFPEFKVWFEGVFDVHFGPVSPRASLDDASSFHTWAFALSQLSRQKEAATINAAQKHLYLKSR